MLSVKRLDKMVVQGFGSEVLAIPAAASLAKSMSPGKWLSPSFLRLFVVVLFLFVPQLLI